MATGHPTQKAGRRVVIYDIADLNVYCETRKRRSTSEANGTRGGRTGGQMNLNPTHSKSFRRLWADSADIVAGLRFRCQVAHPHFPRTHARPIGPGELARARELRKRGLHLRLIEAWRPQLTQSNNRKT